jgi:hypothetical protein
LQEWVLIESQQKLVLFCVGTKNSNNPCPWSGRNLIFRREFVSLNLKFLAPLTFSFSYLSSSAAGDEDLVFTAEPQDAVVSKNSSVVIDCGVPAGWLRDMEEAGPAPFIEWKRDGVLLSLNGENRRYFSFPFSYLTI